MAAHQAAIAGERDIAFDEVCTLQSKSMLSSLHTAGSKLDIVLI